MPQENELMQAMWNSLMQDKAAERRRTYIKYAVLGTIAALYAGAFLFAQMASSSSQKMDGEYANLVRIEGEIGPGKSASAQALVPLLEKAFSDDKAKAVVLLINSPGGTPVQSSLVHDAVVRLKAEHNKPVLAVGEDLVTSGAYFIAVAADKIVVNRSTVTGSIGVVSRGFGFQGLMEKLGVERRVHTAGESKNLGDPFGPETEAGLAKQEELLHAIHAHFKDTVTTGRGGKLDADYPGLFSGTVWTGEQSVAMGLTDELGDLSTAVKKEYGVSKLREVSAPKSLLDIVIGGMATKVMAQVAPALSTQVQLLPE